MFFLLIGRLLDHRTRGKTREVAAHLLALGVTSASRIKGGGSTEVVPAETLACGDLVRVAAGEKVPADGEITLGISDIDGSLVTGESRPVAATIGHAVFAGMVNLSAPVTIRVTAAGQGTLLAEIVRLMEAAETGRARYRLLADRLSRLYAPLVHCGALATFTYWLIAGVGWQVALLRGVAVLIITCPCALGLAIPAVQVVASGRLLRGGILLKSPTALERLADVDHVVFDKTGTLTNGQLQLLAGPRHAPGLLALAAGMARSSRHPLCRALTASCHTALLIDSVQEIPGYGLQSGATRLGSRLWLGLADDDQEDAELWLTTPGHAPLRFAFIEQIRSDAVKIVHSLRNAGYGISLLSGDRRQTVSAVARKLGISDWQGMLDPRDKVGRLHSLEADGHRVLMVGDGLNDAPALAAAFVSMSPSSASDLAQNAADVVFQGEPLRPVFDSLAIARQARRIIKQNLAFALLYNLAAVPLAVLGIVTPPIAAALMSSSSLLVVLNALRLRAKPSGPAT